MPRKTIDGEEYNRASGWTSKKRAQEEAKWYRFHKVRARVLKSRDSPFVWEVWRNRKDSAKSRMTDEKMPAFTGY